MAPSAEPSFDTPNIQASQAGLVLHSTTRIAAPAALVFRSLRNTETWKDWNRFVPRVNITHQPPDEDLATAEEIEELVRNTSIAGSYDSDLTEGMSGGSPKQKTSEDGPPPDTPPLRLRLNSQASRGSHQSDRDVGSDMENGARGTASSPAPNDASASSALASEGEPKLSAAQKYAASQASRKASIASGETPEPVNNQLKAAPVEGPVLVAYAPSSNPTPRTSLSPQDANGRRKSKTPSLAAKAATARARQQRALNLLYGEPPVRLQIGTKMTFFIRMNPTNPREFKQTHFIVTEVSRPDDPVTDGTGLTALTRTKTHTLSRTPVYRIVWAMDNSQSSMLNMKNGSAFPKSLLQTERVSEIRPIHLGDGSEECEYRTWELQKGPLSKVVKKKYEGYLQGQFEVWGKGLGEFCEAMVGKVDRRDFSISIEGPPTEVGVITF